jgi:nucleoside 2-deoxyribosyltransferase
MKTIYLCGPITGLSYHDAVDWRNKATNWFRLRSEQPVGTIDPMQGELKTSVPQERMKDILALDYHYVTKADLILANFLHTSDNISSGSISELAWAWTNRTPIIAIMKEDSPYNNPWLKEMIWYRYDTLEEGLKKCLEIQ